MKTIKCDLCCNDFVSVEFDSEYVELSVWEDGVANTVFLNPDKIRKLRKQLKKALLKIEGVKEFAEVDWFSPGKKVVITGENADFPVGEVVVVSESCLNDEYSKRCDYIDGRDYFYVKSSECKPYKEDEA